MSNQELDKKLDNFWNHIVFSEDGRIEYWDAGTRLSGDQAIKALIRSELDAVMPEQMGLPDTLGTAYWNGAIAQFAQNRKARGL